MSFEYIYYAVAFSLVPLLVISVFHRKLLEKYAGILAKCSAINIAMWLLWDNLAVYYGAWNYSPDKVIGLNILFSPIETYLFAVSTSFALGLAAVILREKFHAANKS